MPVEDSTINLKNRVWKEDHYQECVQTGHSWIQGQCSWCGILAENAPKLFIPRWHQSALSGEAQTVIARFAERSTLLIQAADLEWKYLDGPVSEWPETIVQQINQLEREAAACIDGLEVIETPNMLFVKRDGKDWLRCFRGQEWSEWEAREEVIPVLQEPVPEEASLYHKRRNRQPKPESKQPEKQQETTPERPLASLWSE